MKKKLIWYGGTDTKKNKTEEVLDFKKLKNLGVEVLAIDGIGTLENRLSEKKLNTGKQSQSFSDHLGLVMDRVNGYSEETQITQLNKVFDTFNNLTNPTELVVGGHSRGAAAGVTGFITELYALALVQKSEDFEFAKNKKPKAFDLAKSLENVQKISLIITDPVQGPSDNNLLGLQENLQSKNPVKEMLDTISEIVGKKDLFNVSVFLPRFDPRKTFQLDKRWENYMTKNKGQYQEYNAGFDHSNMVSSKKNPTLYPLDIDGVSPNGLLKKVIQERLGFVTKKELNNTAKDLHNTEVDLIQILKKDNKNRTKTEEVKATDLKTLIARNKTGANHNSMQSALRDNSKSDTPIKINGRLLNPKSLNTKKGNLSSATTASRNQNNLRPIASIPKNKSTIPRPKNIPGL